MLSSSVITRKLKWCFSFPESIYYVVKVGYFIDLCKSFADHLGNNKVVMNLELYNVNVTR